MPELTNDPNGEQTELMEEYLWKKDQLDEPKKTTPSTANGSHDKETRNGGSNPNQVGLTIDESSGREVPIDPVPRSDSTAVQLVSMAVQTHQDCPSELNRKNHRLWQKKRSHIRKKRCIFFAVFSVISVVIFFIGRIAVKPQKSPERHSCPSCPEAWITWRWKCYYFSNAEGTWNSSQNNCSWHGGSLFVPGPEEEMAFVKRCKTDTDYWIGLCREEEGQPWKQPDGSVFNSSFQIRADGHCAYLDKETVRSTWCHTKRNWICTKYLPLA